jgi:hypothetical protein
MWFLGILMALLALAAGFLYRRRLRRFGEEEGVHLSDDMIRQIEERGRVEMDEPLDWDEIRQEEEQFWEETWDEPEEL